MLWFSAWSKYFFNAGTASVLPSSSLLIAWQCPKDGVRAPLAESLIFYNIYNLHGTVVQNYPNGKEKSWTRNDCLQRPYAPYCWKTSAYSWANFFSNDLDIVDCAKRSLWLFFLFRCDRLLLRGIWKAGPQSTGPSWEMVLLHYKQVWIATIFILSIS